MPTGGPRSRGGTRRYGRGVRSAPAAPRSRTRPPAFGRVAGEPAVPMLLAAAAVQPWRDAVVDLVVLLAAVAVIVVERVVRPEVREPADEPVEPVPLGGRGRTLGVLGAGALALLVGGLPRESVAESLALAAPGVVAGALVLRGPVRDGGSSGATGGVAAPGGGRARFVWVGLGLALAGLEAGAFLADVDPGPSGRTVPALSDVVGPLLESGGARAAATFVWVLAGVWLVRRVRATWGAP